MMRFKRLSLFISGTAILLAGLVPVQTSQAEPTYPTTVQVKPGGASIFAQPKSSGEVIGEYKAGVILNPSLRVYSNEGQIWLKIGSHWVPEASLKILEGASSPETATSAPPSTSNSATPSESPSEPATAASPLPDSESVSDLLPPQSAPSGQPLPPPTSSKTRLAVVTASEPDIAINVREQPSTASKAVLAVKPGEQAEVLQQQIGEDTYTWYKLKFTARKAEGWMRGDFVQVKSNSSTPSNQSNNQSNQTSPSPAPSSQNPGSITAPLGVTIVLQSTPGKQTDTAYQATSGQKVEIKQMAKGEDGLAWYAVHLADRPEAKGWVRGDQVRLVVNYATPRSAKLSAPAGQIIAFHPQPALQSALSVRGVSGEQVDVLQQTKGEDGYAWYSVKISKKPSVQGWIKGEYLRLGL
ncbi:SH3 domain-containing protein [Acaryochloris sp. IP29b_bin.148]|uniref:SH3 domain-containing protein n=1 Tax=Acaryochloris sp. IP29b_bin.148 TaxID=2969218 RepID=UPI00261279A8|nr:SH3 domain-containing protein [Acaryochloris sp. IP29b_bin.148]